MYKGIDVSKHQGKIDWEKVKKTGIDFVMIRAGFGTSTIDENFKANIEGALRVGLNVGVYWFSYAYSVAKAKKEAEFLVKILKSYEGKLTMPICFDWEYASYDYVVEHYKVKPTKKLVSDMAIAFLSTLEQAGWYAMNYTNVDYAQRFFDDRVKSRFDTWIAQWSTKCTYTGNYGIWQYGGEINYIDSIYLDGIPAIVDKDYAYKDYPTIIKNAELNGFKKQKFYVIQGNENLIEVAKRCKITVENLIKLNPSLTKAGQKLRIK